MRLALLIDDYLPHSTRVGAKMLHELAVELVRQGHQPVVITPGKLNQQANLLIDNIDGVEIWRFRNGPIKDVSKIKRAINESLLSLNAWLAISGQVKQQPFDGVIYYSPSIFFGPVVKWIKRICSCKSYLILRDLFPQWVIDEGMIRDGSLIARYFRFFEKINYKAADHIGLMSNKNLEVFSQQFPDNDSTHVLFNWANSQTGERPTKEESVRIKHQLDDKVIFFYGGNIGHAQDMSNLMRLSRAMQGDPSAHFLFVGQGDEVELVKRLIREWDLKNVTYLPSVSQEAFKKILTEVDVGLFSLALSHTAHNFPGKILGYMVNSLPILGSVNIGNDLMDVVNDAQAGAVFINGEDDALLSAAKELLVDINGRERKGNAARQLLHDTFSVESAAQQIVNYL